MKLIQIVVYDVTSDTIMSVGDLELPSLQFDEQQITAFDAACNLLASLGLEARLFVATHSNDEVEIWQAIDVCEMLNFETSEPPVEIKWIAPEFIDCKTNGKWQRKYLRGNIPALGFVKDQDETVE